MKNAYFGNINDYAKYGLLRLLSNGGAIKTTVCWMLTDGELAPDSQAFSYLQQPDQWREYDPALFDSLTRSLAKLGNRSVSFAETEALLPSAVYYSKPIMDSASDRQRYFQEFLSFARGNDLVFFDPDRGLEIQSRRYGSKGSSRYLYWNEVVDTFAAGHSILVYQHFPREPHGTFVETMTGEMCTRVNVPEVFTFETTQVVFFLLPQERHLHHFQRMSERVSTVWNLHMWVSRHQCG